MFGRITQDNAALPQNLEAAIRNYAPEAQTTARLLFQLYGMPDEVTGSRMTWFDKGLFFETTVSAEATPHNFPVPHFDTLSQSVYYPVGNVVGKYDQLASFDGSISLHRTQGVITARHDSPALNLIALNLAHEIITGQRNWQQAREYFAQAAKAVRMGVNVPYAKGLIFRPEKHEDADVSL